MIGRTSGTSLFAGNRREHYTDVAVDDKSLSEDHLMLSRQKGKVPLMPCLLSLYRYSWPLLPDYAGMICLSVSCLITVTC